MVAETSQVCISRTNVECSNRNGRESQVRVLREVLQTESTVMRDARPARFITKRRAIDLRERGAKKMMKLRTINRWLRVVDERIAPNGLENEE